MAVDIKLPNLGDGITSGDVLNVLVKEGDQISVDQGIVELETGKATIEVPSTHAGKIMKVHVAPGQTIPIGGVLISVEATSAQPVKQAPASSPGSSSKTAAPTAPQAPAKQVAAKVPESKPAAPAVTASSAPAVTPAKTTFSTSVPAPAATGTTASAHLGAAGPGTVSPSSHSASVSTAESGASIPAGPAVRRFAREVGVDLRNVTGTGNDGRIVRDDVLAVVRLASMAVQTVSGPAKSKTSQPPSSSTPRAAVTQSPTDSVTDQWGPVRLERMPKIRQTIAAKMRESWTTVPRVTNFDDADVTELEKFRQASKDDYAAKGVKLTALPFVVKSVALGLRQHPIINASVDMDNGQIVYKDYVNIGIAVDSDRGLVVPSLRNADRLSISEIAREIAAIAESVRTSSFSIEDLRGSTFSISNLGAIGGTYSTPIINTPEVAILLMGRSRKLPVVMDDQIQIRLMMPLSLSYDHRIVDGAAAARFLNDVIGYLKAPSRLLLAP